MPHLFFNPASIAVIGATADPKKFGNAVTVNILSKEDLKCDIYLVSHGSKEIKGIKTFKSILDISKSIDLAIILVPAKIVNNIIDDCINKKVKRIIIVTAGFGEMDEEGKIVEKKIAEKCKDRDIRVMGPNCVGIQNIDIGLNASFIQTPPLGNMSMITQSGSFGCACLYEMERQNMGCSKFANLGNQIDIAFEDVLSFYKEDENTKVICIYLETITEGRKFFEIIKEIVTYKPIIIQKGGKTPLGMSAASSHTGSIASNYNMTKTAIQQAGAILCNNMSDYITSIKTLSYLPVPITEKIGVLTNSGGTAVLFSDCAEEFGLQFAEFSDILIKKISPFLISLVKKINPLDMIASAFQEQYYQISKAMLEDPEIGIVVACSVIPPFLEIKPDDHFLGIIRAWNETGRKKPIIPLMVFADIFDNLKNIIKSEQIPIFYTPHEAAFATKILIDRMKFLKKKNIVYQ